MPKRPQRSALYFYALDYRRRIGGNMTIKEAIDCSCGQFKSLSVEERAKYETKAKKWREENRRSNPGINSMGQQIGQAIDFVDQTISLQEMHVKICESLIDRIIDGDDIDLFLIFTQTFCITITGKHVAAEFALCKIGSKSEYECSIIDPGKIPTGCVADAKESEEVHHIPADMNELRELKGTRTYANMWVHLRTVLGRRMHQGEPPDFKTAESVLKNADNILFTLEDNVKVCTDVLSSFAADARETCWFYVVSIEALMQVMYRRIYKAKMQQSFVLIGPRIRRIVIDTKPSDFTFAYANNMLTYDHLSHTYSCRFHDLNPSDACSLIKVRMANRYITEYYEAILDLKGINDRPSVEIESIK
ncbi:hypothetical protein ACOME3_004072 [Neoechinorhynchus agilis]